jgi:3-oxoadipate enol-lactonase
MNGQSAKGLNHQVDGPGDAVPLLLCNALGTDLRSWNAVIGFLPDPLRILRYDARGHGRSPAAPGPYTLESLANDALQLLDHLDTSRVNVCGISMGGLIAMWLAINVPQRIDRLILADTAARIGTSELWSTRAEAVEARGMEAVVDTVIERFFSESFRTDRPEEVERARQTLLSTDPEGYAATCRALASADLRAEVSGISRPTLVIVGGADVATTPTEAQWLADTIGGSEFQLIEGAGHLAHIEQPEIFARLVDTFLNPA